MLHYPQIDPIALSLGPFEFSDTVVGPLQIHWYGIMYLLAFACAWLLASRNSQRPWSPIDKTQVEDLIVFGAWGVILGGRFGYMLFYSADKWLDDPGMILRIWEGGMSFHGGLHGRSAGAAAYTAASIRLGFLSLADFVAPLVPSGPVLSAALGNFHWPGALGPPQRRAPGECYVPRRPRAAGAPSLPII